MSDRIARACIVASILGASTLAVAEPAGEAAEMPELPLGTKVYAALSLIFLTCSKSGKGFVTGS